MEPVVIVQARTGSTRLPGKVLLPLAGASVLDRVVDRCRAGSSRVVVATTVEARDDVLAQWGARRGVPVVRGPVEDVLGRFLLVLEEHPCEAAVRVTADCPLLDVDVLRRVRDLVASDEADYAMTGEGWPRGLGSEGFRTAALRAAAAATDPGAPDDAPWREHVTLWIYRHPERFRLRWLPPPPGFPSPPPRLTLDEPDDYRLLEAVFEEPWGPLRPTTADLIGLFRRRPALASINAHVRQKPA